MNQQDVTLRLNVSLDNEQLFTDMRPPKKLPDVEAHVREQTVKAILLENNSKLLKLLKLSSLSLWVLSWLDLLLNAGLAR